MTLDIRGSIKNTKLSHNPYVVFEELLSNAIDSYLIRKHGDAVTPSMKISFDIDFHSTDLLGQVESLSIRCQDNGCGFGEQQLQAFLTKDTSYKDDLAISGIGRCKGAGRIQYFHHFSSLSIDATCRDGDKIVRREMHYREPKKHINASDFITHVGDVKNIGTIVELQGFKDGVRRQILRDEKPSTFFSACILKKQMLVTFLQRLIGLEGRLGDFEICFASRNLNDTDQYDVLRRSDLPVVTNECVVSVEECDPLSGIKLGTSQVFRLSHYRLSAIEFSLPKNAIAFCAKSSPVKDVTPRYLRTRAEQSYPVNGFHHIVLIESDYFDQQVNEQRDDFDNIPDEIPTDDLFCVGKVSYAAIYEALDSLIDELVTPADWNKEEVLQDVISQFGINEAMLQDTSTRIVYGESAQSVAERVLKKYQERVIDETAQIFNLKQEIIKAEPDSEIFRKKINELAWKYTSSLKNFDMANLSQLIVRRAAIVQVLDLACNKKLAVQNVSDNARRKDERIIHSVFFPMRKDSTTAGDHDIWLLSEEYHYYDYIASDVPLSNIHWDDGRKVFDSDIDESFAALLAARVGDNGGKRPDIALFNKEGSAIIIEFKAPGVSMDEHIGDLAEYAHLLAAKSGGKLRKFYGYLIGDMVNPLRLSGTWTPFPTGDGWFQSSPLIDPRTRLPLGETYFEILHFSDVIDRAKKRIGVYQDKLKFNIGLTDDINIKG